MKTRTPRLRVLLVDDHALFRAGLRSLLERELGVQITAECATAEEALQSITPPLPDVALLDISLRGSADGIELARQIVNNFEGQVRCIMVSMHLSAQYVMRAFEAGASGYVVKDAGPTELISAIRTALSGQRYLSPGASDDLIESLKRGDSAALHGTLTPRQLEVLRMVAQGKNTKRIARELGLSTKTVDSHRYQISQRLGLHDVASMVRYAIANGLANPAAR